ncbi:MAG: tetratricopeptide repeat protein [Pirellulales bacterium]|nr:tetratricopeptide repeat protein [Pirellulales bacterium]
MRFESRLSKLLLGFLLAGGWEGMCAKMAEAQLADPLTPPAETATTETSDEVDVAAELEKGEAALKEKDYKAALQAFTAALSGPATAEDAGKAQIQASLGRGNALIGLKEYTAAKEEFNRIIEASFDANSPAVYAAKLGRARAALELGEAEDALKDLGAVASALGDNVEAQLGLGKAYSALGQVEAAIPPLTRAIELDEKNAEAYRLRGISYAGLFKNKQAIEDLQKSIELDPEVAETYYTLGMVYLRAEEFQKSVEEFGKAIDHFKPKEGEEDQPYLQGFLTASSAYIDLGKNQTDPVARNEAYTAALEFAKKALAPLDEKNPLHTQARAAILYSKGVAERMLGNYGDAVRSFSQSIELNPELGDAYFRRGICFHMLGEDHMAIEDFKQASHLNAEPDPRLNLWEGFTYAKLGEYNEAIRAYGDAIAESDRYTPAYYNRALAYMMLGDLDKAIKDFNQALRLSPNNADYYFHRGVAYELKKENDRASDSFARAIEFDNAKEPAYRHMATVQQALGRAELANQYRQKADELAAEKK